MAVDGDADSVDILIVENVDDEPFRSPDLGWRVRRDPDLWSQPERLLAAVGGCRALVVRNQTAVDARLLAAAGRLQVVARAGVGLDNIDLPAAAERGVVVISPTGANARSVAEHTLGLALALARRTVTADRDARAGRWVRAAGTEIGGGTWGLIGVGATGRAVATLARGLGCRVIGYDPNVQPGDAPTAAAGVQLTTLDAVAHQSDVLSIHVPATPATRGMVDARFLARMRDGSLLVNVGRGEVIDEAALVAALRRGRPAGAALDVRASEPPVLGELEQLDSVILTPHIAGITRQSQQRIGALLASDIAAVLAGDEASHAVGSVRRHRLADRMR
jgi:D-3-phosphoglycerate dehydrogenase/(S)-sulfolactate dehydrogenase